MIKSYKESKSYEYATKVVSGELVASKFIILQAKSYLKDLERKDLYFDLEWHNKVSLWFEKVCYVPELNAPVELPLHHAFWIEQIYCLRYRDNKRRKYKNVYMQVARKQAKTFYAAIVALFELVWGADKDAQIMCGANSRDQAIICTEMMGKIVKKSPILKEFLDDGLLEVFTQKKKVTEILYDNEDEGRLSRIEAMPREPGDGGNPSAVIIDELHEAKDLALLETMKSGQGLRKEPIVVIITSPGHDKDAPCYSVLRDKAVKILNGTVEDDRFLPIMFELDNEADWDNFDELIKSNPMIPYIEPLAEQLRERIKEAKNVGGAIEVSVKIKNCGIWVDAAQTWIQQEILLSNDHGVTDEELLGKECYTGLDLAKADDLNAFAMFFPNVRQDVHAVKMMFWIPKDKVNNNRDGVDYRRWIDQGFNNMIEQDGNVADHMMIARDIIAEVKEYNLMSFGYDAKYAIMAILPMMAEAGYEDELKPVGQGFKLRPAVVEMQNLLKRKHFDLRGNKVLLWNFANTVMRLGEQGDQYPAKNKSGNKIDGVSALLTAYTEYMRINADPIVHSGVIEVW